MQGPVEKAKWTFNYNTYATEGNEFESWVDGLFRVLKLPVHVAAPAIGIAIFVGGLCIALTIDFQGEYLSTPAIYIGCFGIAWVLGFIHYGSSQIHKAYEDLRPCFLVDDKTYIEKITYWFYKIRSTAGNLWAVGLLIIFDWTVVYLAFFRPDLLEVFKIGSLRPLVFPAYWYYPENIYTKAMIIAYYGVFVALPLATSIRMLSLNIRFLLDLRHFPVIPIANVIRHRLRKITNFHMIISATWFVGVALFGMTFFRQLDLLAGGIILVLSSLGILTFLVPQLVFRVYLIRSYGLACDLSLVALNRTLDITLVERKGHWHPASLGTSWTKLDNLSDIIQTAVKPPLWVYSARDFALLLFGQLIALLSVYLRDLVV